MSCFSLFYFSPLHPGAYTLSSDSCHWRHSLRSASLSGWLCCLSGPSGNVHLGIVMFSVDSVPPAEQVYCLTTLCNLKPACCYYYSAWPQSLQIFFCSLCSLLLHLHLLLIHLFPLEKMPRLFKALNTENYIQTEVTGDDSIPRKIWAFTANNMLMND